MIYIVMCGGQHEICGVPRNLIEIGGERLVDRTIRLLRENYVNDIAITTTNEAFNNCDAEIINYDSSGEWVNAFYLTDDPVCYIFGDVYYSDAAIKTIVETQTNDIEFFASAPPFASKYIKPWAEPFAFKVVNTQHFRESVEKTREFWKNGYWRRHPIAWELWQIIKDTPINKINYNNYTVINDFTCDIDSEMDMRRLKQTL